MPTQHGWKRHLARVARMAGFNEKASAEMRDKTRDKKDDKEEPTEQDLYIQRLLDEQNDLLMKVDQLETTCKTRASPTKEELLEKLRKAEKAAVKAGKERKKEQPRKQLAAMEEASSESDDDAAEIGKLLQALKDKKEGKSEAKTKDKHQEEEKNLARGQKRRRGSDDDASDHEDSRYIDVMEEKQALKVIQITGIRCGNPNRVAKFINAKFKFHNLADMWPALCAVVDGRSDRPLLLAVDSASYEEYMGGRTSRQAAMKGVAMSMKIEECRWGTVTCHIAKEQATPVGRARPNKGGDPVINVTTAGLCGAPDRLVILTMAPYTHTRPFLSLWGMGHQERTGGEVTFALQVPVEFARQAIVHKGMWVQKEATKKFRPGTPLPKQKYKLAIQGERPLHPSVLDAPEVSMEWGLQHHIAKTPAAPATRKQPYGPVLPNIYTVWYWDNTRQRAESK